MKLITIIIPVFNEESSINNIFDKITLIKKKLIEKYTLEILFADNNSSDSSFDILSAIAVKNKWVKVMRYSRNYGYQRSIFEAIKHVNSDAAVIIDCDLQDPPDLILNFINLWESGYKNVYGIRKKRKENWIFFRNLFYRILNRLSDIKMPINAGDFRLIDKVIIEKIKNITQDTPYLRGIIASIGFSSKGIEYSRSERKVGKTSAGFFKLLKLAIESITQFSTFPIRLLSIFGLLLIVILFFIIVILIIMRFIFGVGTDIFLPRGFTTTWILVLGSIAINALFLGVIGEYVLSIHKEIFKLNKVFLRDKINFDNKNQND